MATSPSTQASRATGHVRNPDLLLSSRKVLFGALQLLHSGDPFTNDHGDGVIGALTYVIFVEKVPSFKDLSELLTGLAAWNRSRVEELLHLIGLQNPRLSTALDHWVRTTLP